eukprot:12931003-Prorocentrum_lima.AAC.1
MQPTETTRTSPNVLFCADTRYWWLVAKPVHRPNPVVTGICWILCRRTLALSHVLHSVFYATFVEDNVDMGLIVAALA